MTCFQPQTDLSNWQSNQKRGTTHSFKHKLLLVPSDASNKFYLYTNKMHVRNVKSHNYTASMYRPSLFHQACHVHQPSVWKVFPQTEIESEVRLGRNVSCVVKTSPLFLGEIYQPFAKFMSEFVPASVGVQLWTWPIQTQAHGWHSHKSNIFFIFKSQKINVSPTTQFQDNAYSLSTSGRQFISPLAKFSKFMNSLFLYHPPPGVKVRICFPLARRK